jgi:hypothetical protein
VPEHLGVVDKRLGELDALLHAGRVAADLAVSLLVQPNVAQNLGGPLAGRGSRKPGDAGHVGDEVRRADVRREAVVLGHIADDLPDGPSLADGIHAEDRGPAARRRQQAEEYLEKRALAGSVGPNQADDSGLDRQVELIESLDRPVVLGQTGGLYQRHRCILPSPVRRGVIIRGEQRSSPGLAAHHPKGRLGAGSPTRRSQL